MGSGRVTLSEANAEQPTNMTVQDSEATKTDSIEPSSDEHELVAYAFLCTDASLEYRELTDRWGDQIVAVDGAQEVVLFDGDPDRAWETYVSMVERCETYEVGGRLNELNRGVNG